MHELDSITVRGFKSIAALEELKLGPANVVVGPNGSGKSNFIGVFAFLHAICKGRVQDYVARAGGADRVLHFGSRATSELYIHVGFGGGRHQYEITLVPTGADQLAVSSEAVHAPDPPRSLGSHGEPLNFGREAGLSAPGLGPVGSYVRRHLERWRVYHFNDTGAGSPMRKTADVNDNRFLRPDASNLAPFLYLLREQHPGSYSLIRRTVQQVAPFFEDFALEPLRLNTDTIRLEWRHAGSDAYFDAAALSDGTLRFMALATLLLQPEESRPSVLLIDEPELGLHPYAISLLSSLVKQASVKTQVILSTESPQLLDHFDPEDVLVADRVGGRTQLTRLERAPLASWLEEYSLGQLWEKNEIGGRPRPERAVG